jgi:predicted Rossmann fold nucleotide-binding protein DprA/Smf involved in DNA uptake
MILYLRLGEHGHRLRDVETGVQRTMAAGRPLLISPFGEKARRMTADKVLTRNRFVATLAATVLIA